MCFMRTSVEFLFCISIDFSLEHVWYYECHKYAKEKTAKYDIFRYKIIHFINLNNVKNN